MEAPATYEERVATAIRLKNICDSNGITRETPFPEFATQLLSVYGKRFFSHPSMQEIKDDPERVRLLLLRMFSLVCWADAGLAVFDVTHSLMAGLVLTDPSDVDCEEVRLPFRSFCIRLPLPFWKFTRNGSDVDVVTAEVFSFTAVKQLEGSVATVPYLSLSLAAKNHVASITERLPSFFGGQGKIVDWIDSKHTNFTDDENLMINRFKSALVNLCLYVSDRGKGERSGKSLHSYNEQRPNIWILGREVKLDRELVASARSFAVGWKISSQFTVRGHWRMQAHGEGRLLRKRIWIEPHRKGQGPNLQHIYKP